MYLLLNMYLILYIGIYGYWMEEATIWDDDTTHILYLL